MKGKQFSDAFILFASLCLHIAVWDSISISIDLNIPIGIKMLFWSSYNEGLSPPPPQKKETFLNFPGSGTVQSALPKDSNLSKNE